MASITVLLDHSDFIIADKPEGIPVQDELQTLGIIPRLCKQLQIEKLWLVHRLDKVTSGLLILAKNQKAAGILSTSFARREIEKYYIAISHKKPSKKQGSVIGDMRKVRSGIWILTQNTQRPAITQFDTVGIGDGKRLFLVKPITGKTHQIRVMMKSLGSPILGDTHYKGVVSDRTYLHAYALKFNYQGQHFSMACAPSTGELFGIDKIGQALENNREPWLKNWPKVKNTLLKRITQ